MRQLVLIISMIFLFGAYDMVSAQEYELRMEKVRKGEIRKTKVFPEGEVLVIKTTDGIRQKGVFAVNDNNSIIFDDGSIVQLDHIKRIRKPNAKLLGGLTLVTLGSFAFAGGLSALVLDNLFIENNEDGAEIATVLGLVGLIGGHQLLTNYDYKPKKGNWKLLIVQK